MSAGRTSRRAGGRRNRRHGPSLWTRLPGPRALGRALLRGLRRAAPAVAVVAGVAAVAGGVHLGWRWVTGSERFAVAEIEISGNRAVSEERIRARLSGAEGENIFRLDLRALEEELEADPWIESAAVDRRLPDRLDIRIVERRAAALVELGGLYLADADGRPFKRAEVGEDAGLPLVTGLARDDFRRAPEAIAARVRDALALAAAWAAGPGRPALGEIDFHPRQGVVLHTRETDLAIRIGHISGDEAAARLGAFDAAWAALADDERALARVVYLDNRTRPDRITVGFEGVN